MEPRVLFFDQDARKELLAGAQVVYEAVKSTFGPSASNVVIEKSWGKPVLTRDGVTVARDVFLKDRAKNQGAKLIIEASEKTNDRAGDGTSATAVVAYHILAEATKQIAAGANPMELRASIMKSIDTVKYFVDDQTVQVDDKKLREVATVSCGDKAMGELIADTIIQIGENGKVHIEEHNDVDTKREMVEGFYYDRGYSDRFMITDFVREKCELSDVYILATNKQISTNAHILQFLNNFLKEGGRNLMIIGNVSGEALMTLGVNKQQGKFNVLVTPIPMFGDMEMLFLEDVAALTGGRAVGASESLDTLKFSDLGHAEKIVATNTTTTILGGEGAQEDVDARIAAIKAHQKEETNTLYQERLELRLSKLSGKIAILRVGASSDVAREELKFRVEDAVNATINARREGIVAGGGTTLLRASQLNIDKVLAHALAQPFTQLMLNAGQKADYFSERVLTSETPNAGYNLRKKEGHEPVDMVEEGIIDPSLTIKQVVENAATVAANIITAGCVMIFDKDEEPKQ